MIKKLLNSKENDYTIRENMIIRIMVCGFLINLLALLEEILVAKTLWQTLPMVVIALGLIFCMVLMFKFKKSEAAAVLTGLIIIVIAFPTVFFVGGGIDGGSTIWFVLGIFYFIGMFHGKVMVILTTLAIAVDSFVYYYAFNHPDLVIKMETEKEVYFDSLFGVILVGVLLGTVTKYQLMAYDKERIKAVTQKEDVEKLSDSKNDFFASMSHEIRTPINTIIGLDEMILREENISEETIENAITIQNASKMLLSLVNDILDLSQIESKKMEIIPTEYRTTMLFSDLIDMIRIRIEEKDLDFNIQIDKNFPKVLYGDDKRLKQIILNLLSNAAKYTNQGSVTFVANAEKIGEEWCKITIAVIDTGIGIKSEYLDSMFDSFTRVDSDTRKIEGTGLGLSISKQLVEMMGGKITVDSIYTKGSTFTVMIEQQIVDATPIGNINFLGNNKEREIYRQKFEAPEARLLVVDDNEINRSVITKLLRATKLQIDTAYSGEACLKKTEEKHYDVILMDYMMPGMNGDEVARLVRKQENGLCHESAIIALTADGTFGRKHNISDIGFDSFVEKPIKSSELESEILRFLPDDVIEYRLKTYDRANISTVENIHTRKKRRILVTTDCVCDIPAEVKDIYELKTVYSYINTGHSRFTDTLEIDSNNLELFLSESESNVSVEPASVEDYEKFFAECLIEVEDVIHVSLGANIGDSYKNAISAARGFGHVHVIDSGHLSGGMSLLVLHVSDLVSQGNSVNEVMESAEKIKQNIKFSCMVPSPTIFYKNGYINGFWAKITDWLHIHPIFKNRQGELRLSGFSIGKMQNTRRRYIKRRLLLNKSANTDVCYVTHAGLSVSEQEEIAELIKSVGRFNNVFVENSSVSSACLSGLGTIGIAFYVE